MPGSAPGFFYLHLDMFKIALTGGIGSGKTTVAKIFEVLGIPVYYADTQAKKLMQTKPELIEKIQMLFGNESYTNGQLNRKFIAQQIFKEKEKLQKLNAIVHPYTIEHADKWLNEQNTPYAIKEAALIFESGTQGDFDKVIGVFAPKNLRIQRTMQRDDISHEEVKERMMHQIDDEIKVKLCDEVIINDEQKMIVPQVLALHKKILQLSDH